MTKTVAVTGATGFIGKHIVEALLTKGFMVRALTRGHHNSCDNRLAWVHGSLEDTRSLSALVTDADYVVHCAGQVRGHTEDIFTQCNVTGSLRLLQAAGLNGQCQRFLFISSLAARHPELSWYAKSKYDAEQQLTAMAAKMGVPLGIFRPTAVYGLGDKELKPILNGLLRGFLPQFNTPEARLSFLHVYDLADAVCQWLITEPVPTGAYELCDGIAGGYDWKHIRAIGEAVRHAPVRTVGIPLSVLKFMARLNAATFFVSRKEPMLTPGKIRELVHLDWSASNESLSEKMNWTPRVSLEQALRDRLF